MRRRGFISNLALALPMAHAADGFAARIQELSESINTAENEKALWERIRQEFLFHTGLVHFNTGSLGATPRRVLEAMSGWMYQLEGDPVSNVFGPLGYRMEQVRAKAAALLGATLEEMLIVENTTSAMNSVALSLAKHLKPGDEILTTNHEHPGGAVCWEYLVKNHGVKLIQISMPAPVKDQAQIIQLVKDHLTPRTRICSFSHVDTITGLQMPIRAISELTRPREIFLVCDGAQAPGMIQVDVKKLGVDTYASSSHKWLLAPKGSGLLYIRKEMQDQIQPLPFSTGYQAYTAATGTRNVVNVLGHGMAIDFHMAIGSSRVEARSKSLSIQLRNRLSENPNLELLTPTQPELATGLVSFKLKKSTAAEVFTRLQKEHNILVKVVAKPEYNAIRFSTHVYNNEEETERTAKAIERILKS